MTKEERRELFLTNMAKGRARKKAKTVGAIEGQTTAVVVTESGNNGNGNEPQPVPPEILAGDIKNAFTQNQGYSAIKTLVDPGEANELESLLMRGSIPDKPTEGNIMVVAITHLYDQYERHHYKRGMARLRNLLAGNPSVRGERAQMVVEAIIGERRQRREENQNFTDKLGKIAKHGFGSNKESEDGL